MNEIHQLLFYADEAEAEALLDDSGRLI